MSSRNGQLEHTETVIYFTLHIENIQFSVILRTISHSIVALIKESSVWHLRLLYRTVTEKMGSLEMTKPDCALREHPHATLFALIVTHTHTHPAETMDLHAASV